MIKLINENKDTYIDLLLLADPDIDIINSYIDDGDLFVLFNNDIAVTAAIVTKIDDNTCELKNIATYEAYQGHGFGKKLIKYIFEYYKNQYENIIVGTGNSSISNIAFYKSLGFNYDSTLENFFVDNYPEPIFEDGIQCKDMLLFKKAL